MNSITRRVLTGAAMGAIVSGIAYALDASTYVAVAISAGIGLLVSIAPDRKDKQ